MTLLSIDDIHVHENVRVSEEGIEALARSMNAIGQISPVTVIRNEVGYHHSKNLWRRLCQAPVNLVRRLTQTPLQLRFPCPQCFA